jgi:chaperonin cofactor prefoldin
MEDKDKRITELEKTVKAQQEEIDTLKRQVYRLLHPYAPNDPRPAHIVDLNR